MLCQLTPEELDIFQKRLDADGEVTPKLLSSWAEVLEAENVTMAKLIKWLRSVAVAWESLEEEDKPKG